MHHLGSYEAFVLGPGRCGSTMLSNVLRTHPDVLSLSEFFSMQGTRGLLPGKLSGADYWKRVSQQSRFVRQVMTPENAPNEFLYRPGMGRFPIDNVPPLLASVLPHLSNKPDDLFDELAKTVPNQPRQSVEQHHAMLFDRLRELCGGRVWVERTGMSIMYTRLIPKLFPEAKIIMMYRDGRDVVLSYRSFKPIWPMIWGWIWSRRMGPNPLDLDYPSGRSRWLNFNERFLTPAFLVNWIFNNPPPLEECAAFWSTATLQSLPEFAALSPEKRMFLRFEKLTEEPRGELTRLTAFLDVETSMDWLDSATTIPQRLEPRWKKLDAEQREDLTSWTQEARDAVDRMFPQNEQTSVHS